MTWPMLPFLIVMVGAIAIERWRNHKEKARRAALIAHRDRIARQRIDDYARVNQIEADLRMQALSPFWNKDDDREAK